jgi:hypothetical protein
MVEVGLSDGKLTVNFKAKREKQVLEQFKPKKVSDEKTSQ